MERLNIFDNQPQISIEEKAEKSSIINIDNQKIYRRYKLHCISKGLTQESLKAIVGNDLRLFLKYIRDTSLSKVDHFLVQDFLLYCQEERKNGDEALSRKFTSLNTFF